MGNILSDFHHQDLYYGLQLLFEKRLGHNLFRPIGLEWYKEGFWNVYPSPDTAEQYLRVGQGYKPKDGTVPLNETTTRMKYDTYTCEDKHNNTLNRAITLEGFKNMDIDIVIASIPQHIKPFKELAKMKNAKFIFQMGNMFDSVISNLHEIPNLLASTVPINVPLNCNAVFYHQEFDLDIFKPTSIPPINQIPSFINCLMENTAHSDYYTLKSELPGFNFKSYGAQNDDGVIDTTKEMAAIMQQSYVGFHVKSMGDGFGHVLYNWYACGKPVITRLSDYKGKLGEELLDKDTCFDLDDLTLSGLCDRLNTMSPQEYEFMCQQSYKRFKDKVNYDQEEIKIRKFLEDLK